MYPVYLDKNKTKVQGRKVTLDVACPIVSASHIFEACKRLKLGRVLEVGFKNHSHTTRISQKLIRTTRPQPRAQHPRDWGRWGRVRVQIKTPEGTLCDPDIKTRKDLFAKICKVVPEIKMPERKVERLQRGRRRKRRREEVKRFLWVRFFVKGFNLTWIHSSCVEIIIAYKIIYMCLFILGFLVHVNTP